MAEALLLAGALAGNTGGLAWLALAMDVHWRQVSGGRPLPRSVAAALRVLGAAALVLALFLCFSADHVTTAPLVWIMACAAGGLAVAFILAWHPRMLRPLIARLPRALNGQVPGEYCCCGMTGTSFAHTIAGISFRGCSVAFVVYVDGEASWTATTIEQAEQLAWPHVNEGRSTAIEGNEGVGPLRRWIFSAGDDKWIEQALPGHSLPSPSRRNPAN